MKSNRSIPAATVIPVLTYPDVRAAVAWLAAAFGFVERVQIGENHRAQLSVGDGAVIVADVSGERRPPRPGEITQSVTVRIDDARAHCDRARLNGARIDMVPTDFQYGERQYTAKDPAGHHWTFSETINDVAPEEWGGVSVTDEHPDLRDEATKHALPLGDTGAQLGPLEPSRAEEFLAHMDRGRAFIGQHIGLPDVVTDVATSRSFLQSYADKAASDSGRIYGIWMAGALVGGVLFRTMDVKQGTAEAGCWLEPSAVGKGLVTRASRVIIDWAIEERGIHRIEWLVSAENEASIAVARRLGMTRDGVLRESYPRNGTRHDIEVWSVLAPEWRR